MGVMRCLAEEYMDLANMRNNLLHATWFVGYVFSADPLCSNFVAHKFSITKDGLASINLPKNASQLKELSRRCDVVRSWIAWTQCCITGDDKISDIAARWVGLVRTIPRSTSS